MEVLVALEEGHLPDNMGLVTIVVKIAISRKTAGQRETALVGTHPRSTQVSFHNGLLKSILFQIPNILQQPQ